jgi:Tol biopolymer transport system component
LLVYDYQELELGKKMKKTFFILFLILSGTIYAQYFGRNKVQYERFDFKSLRTENFNIMFYPEAEEAVDDAARMLERWYTRFRKVFTSDIEDNQPIILYANHADFQQTNVISGLIPQGTGGVTEAFMNRVILPFTGIYAENDHVLGHELVHAFQYNIIKAAPQGLASAGQVPLWFIEGLAEYLTIGNYNALTAMWMRDAVLNDDIPTIAQVSRSFRYFPYRYGHALWSYFGGIYGDQIISQLFSSVLFSGWEAGFRNTLNTSIDSLSVQWQQAMRDLYTPQLEGRTIPSETGESLIEEEGGMNLSPSISPDGKTVAFLSTRELFTLNLYLADAETGRIIRRLVSSNTDSHFDAIRFMNTSGAWSPDGNRFAFMTVHGGNETLTIVEVSSGRIERTISPEGITAIYHVSWSPDGETLLLSAGRGGISDLFLYNLSNDQLTRLTNDRYADIQPAWSPDSRRIIFSTDRGPGTNLDSLNYSEMKLAIMDIDTRNIQLITISDTAKHINPHFSADGNSIYFVSNPDGFSDIYRYNLADGEVFRLTRTATGISGLTENSPAISVSQERIVFSIFDKTNYNLRSISTEEGTAYQEQNLFAANTQLPPVTFIGKLIVDPYLADPATGLPDTTDYTVTDYRPRLGLMYIGQPTVGVVFDRFSSGIGGGVSALFGDLLGDHILASAVAIQGTFRDLGGQVLYQNLTSRVNWGAAVGHIPYMTGYLNYGRDTVNVDGSLYLADVITLVRQRVFLTGFSGFAQYPLTMNRRFEVSAGYTRIGFHVEAERSVIVSNQIVGRDNIGLPAPSALNLYQSSLAYVGDFSFFGFTSPVFGSRFRFEVEGTVGTFQFASLLGDYRRYFFMNPLTFAVRGLHYGRYLGDSENRELTPLFIGYETFVRGYSVNSFTTDDCTRSGDPSRCPEFDRLVGTRLALFNAELRIPLLGTDQFGLINFPYLPTELVAFFDGGTAWTRDEAPVWKWDRESSERIPVFSAGGAARVNLFGYIVLEFFYAYPFQRPGRGMQFGLSLQPGW